MYRLSDDLLDTDFKETARICPEYKELIERFKVSPFHLSVGLIPPGIPLIDFENIRTAFFTGRHDSILSFPCFPIIRNSSTAVDVKNFLRVAEVPESKVAALPDKITGRRYLCGWLGPHLDTNDLMMARDILLEKYVRLQCLLSYQDKLIRSKIVGIFSSEFGVDIECVSDLKAHFVKTPKDVTTYRMDEYRIPCQNYKAAIIDGVVCDLSERFKCSTGDVFSSMVHLTNASGTGKTRAALELGNLTNVLPSWNESLKKIWKCPKMTLSAPLTGEDFYIDADATRQDTCVEEYDDPEKHTDLEKWNHPHRNPKRKETPANTTKSKQPSNQQVSHVCYIYNGDKIENENKTII